MMHIVKKEQPFFRMNGTIYTLFFFNNCAVPVEHGHGSQQAAVQFIFGVQAKYGSNAPWQWPST